jgi:aspartate racemase
MNRSDTPCYAVPGAAPSTAPLGLIGGMSWRSANLYYQRINHSMERRHGLHRNATGMLASLEYASLLNAAGAGRWDQVEQAIVEAGKRLQDAGCGVVALTAVTAHISHPALRDALIVPVPHVLDPVAARLDALGAGTVAVLGTARTCTSPFVVEKLARPERQVVFAPVELQARIDRLIQERLTAGNCAASDRELLIEAVECLRKQGADAVVLACTELPLLLPLPVMPGLPTILDAVDLHVESLCDLISTKAAT